MNRRKAMVGILAVTGMGMAAFTTKKFFFGNPKVQRGQLRQHLSLISEMIDIIIPHTDTPGAKEAHVQDYIVGYMEFCATNKEYVNFLHGLYEVQDTCNSMYGANFEGCTMEEKSGILKDLDGSYSANNFINKIEVKLRGRSFFTILRSLTIEGYCTSKLGATELLAYQPVPAVYQAEINIQPTQKAWATR